MDSMYNSRINRTGIEQYSKNIREHDREEFRKLLLEDEVIRNNTKLQKNIWSYMISIQDIKRRRYKCIYKSVIHV